ncbi:MAG: diaminopimelate epimerase [Clostridiales bacterium]|nr:diaminopimelate epimerase [Clostridiales bacterium]
MKFNFTKMHGIGNDYVYVNCMEKELEKPEEISIAVSPRHFSVGSDGLIMICASDKADAKMRIFNADGSEAKMCGNGIRCVGKYIYDKGIVDKSKTEVTVDTLSGIKTLKLNVADGKVESVCVDMGKAILEPEKIPVLAPDIMISKPVMVDGKEYKLTAVSMGNPHAVCFVDDVDSLDLEKIGPDFENLSIFPDRVNTEFVRVIDDKTLQMRVWERGSGETFACGTGTCATVVAACLNGICKQDTDVTVHLIGGDLVIRYCSDGTVFMTGPAAIAYEGVYEYEYKD